MRKINYFITAIILVLWLGGMFYIHNSYIKSGRYELNALGERKSGMETNGYKILPWTLVCLACWAVVGISKRNVKKSSIDKAELEPSPGEWVCKKCAIINGDEIKKCNNCQTERS
jgi:hypothetical protein